MFCRYAPNRDKERVAVPHYCALIDGRIVVDFAYGQFDSRFKEKVLVVLRERLRRRHLFEVTEPVRLVFRTVRGRDVPANSLLFASRGQKSGASLGKKGRVIVASDDIGSEERQWWLRRVVLPSLDGSIVIERVKGANATNQHSEKVNLAGDDELLLLDKKGTRWEYGINGDGYHYFRFYVDQKNSPSPISDDSRQRDRAKKGKGKSTRTEAKKQRAKLLEEEFGKWLKQKKRALDRLEELHDDDALKPEQYVLYDLAFHAGAERRLEAFESATGEKVSRDYTRRLQAISRGLATLRRSFKPTSIREAVEGLEKRGNKILEELGQEFVDGALGIVGRTKTNSVSMKVKSEIQGRTSTMAYFTTINANYFYERGIKVSFKLPDRDGLTILGADYDAYKELLSIGCGTEITIFVKGTYEKDALWEILRLIACLFKGKYYRPATKEDRKKGRNYYLDSERFDRELEKIFRKYGIGESGKSLGKRSCDSETRARAVGNSEAEASRDTPLEDNTPKTTDSPRRKVSDRASLIRGDFSVFFRDEHSRGASLGLRWETEEDGIKNVREAIKRERPHLWRKYEQYKSLSDGGLKERLGKELRKAFYSSINHVHFWIWDICAALYKDETPYFGGTYITALKKSFPELRINPLGFRLDWSTEERGIASVRFVIQEERPELWKRYEVYRSLSDSDRRKERLAKELRDAFYSLTSADFALWGIHSIMNKGRTPYFKGNHAMAFQKAFPELDFNPLGFQLGWSTEEKGIESVRYVIQKEKPNLWKAYQNYKNLDHNGREVLRAAFYSIGLGHFAVWHLQTAVNRNCAPYFDGSHIVALQKSFLELELNPLGFELDWSTEERAIESVRYVIRREKPYLWERYQNYDRLSDCEKEELRNAFYVITGGHFRLWNLDGARKRRGAPYFGGSYITALQKSFPKLGYSIEEKGCYMKVASARRFSWKSEREGIDNVRQAVMKFIEEKEPGLWKKYEDLENLGNEEKEEIKEKFRNHIYSITAGHFMLWKISTAMNAACAPYFDGSHIKALQVSFPGLDLNHLGFGLDWSMEERGIRSVRYVIQRERPHFWQKYEEFRSLSDDDKGKKVLASELRDVLYAIDVGHFNIWGLGVAGSVSYFGASHITALQKSFPDLALNRLGFELDWSTKQKGVESVHFVIQKEQPSLWEKYETYLNFDDNAKKENLRREIIKAFYSISKAHFGSWGLGAALDRRKAPYFKGSYITVLKMSFPKLGLNRLGFCLEWETEEDGIASVRFVVQRERPDLWARYRDYDYLTDEERLELRADFYALKSIHFEAWGAGAMKLWRLSPYFGGSYITALQKCFPKLGLEREGFRSAAVESGVRPVGNLETEASEDTTRGDGTPKTTDSPHRKISNGASLGEGVDDAMLEDAERISELDKLIPLTSESARLRVRRVSELIKRAQGLYEKAGRAYVKVYRFNGGIAAFISAYEDDEGQLYIARLAVEKALREQGIATKLFDALLESARRDGFQRFWLFTQNGFVKKIAKRRGFVENPHKKGEYFLTTSEGGASLGKESREVISIVRKNIDSARTGREILIDGRDLERIDPSELDALCKNEAIGLHIIWPDGVDREARLRELGLYKVFMDNNRWDAMNLDAEHDMFAGYDSDSERFEKAVEFYSKGLSDIRHCVVLTSSDFVPRGVFHGFGPQANVLRINEETKHALLLAEYLAQIGGRLNSDAFSVFDINGVGQYYVNALCVEFDLIREARELTGQAA